MRCKKLLSNYTTCTLSAEFLNSGRSSAHRYLVTPQYEVNSRYSAKMNRSFLFISHLATPNSTQEMSKYCRADILSIRSANYLHANVCLRLHKLYSITWKWPTLKHFSTNGVVNHEKSHNLKLVPQVSFDKQPLAIRQNTIILLKYS